MEDKPRNPYANLKAAKREQTSKAVVGASTFHPLWAMVADLCPKPQKKAAAKRAGRGIEGRQGDSINKTVAKKTTVAKGAAIPPRKRKADEDLKEVSAAVRDVAKEATSTIYIKRKVEAKAKVEAVADTKLVESEATMSLGKKRKAADALEGDAAQAVVHGDDAPSTKKRRTKDEPVVETEPVEEKMTVLSGEKKAKKSKDDEVFGPQDVQPGVAHMYP